ncbi:MAG: NADH-quinone oxidoreductase subunit NuoH [Pirellulales bacterium]
MSPFLIATLVKIALMLGGLMTAAAYFVLLERWIAAWVQDRKGPNRVGLPLTDIKLFGLGQPLADGLKFIFKESYTPGHVDKALFSIAPVIILAAALAIFAVIPFGSVVPDFTAHVPYYSFTDWTWKWWSQSFSGDEVDLVIAPGVDVGLIYVFALSGIAVYGVILGGWASNNKYSFLGGLRSSAQLIAYEIPLGLGILGVILATGSLRLEEIINHQAQTGAWNILVQPLGFIVFLVAATAESARLPFDLPEAEQELIGGYHTEYSGMKFILYAIAEFLHMITASFLIVIMFLGGWHLWGVTGSEHSIGWIQAVLRIAIFSAKIVGVILFFMLVRWSWPRFRFDQLMTLAWKVMLPLGLINLVAVTILVELEAQGKLAEGSHVIWAVVGWAVMIAAWAGAAYIAPLATDNKPRLGGAGMLEPETLLS